MIQRPSINIWSRVLKIIRFYKCFTIDNIDVSMYNQYNQFNSYNQNSFFSPSQNYRPLHGKLFICINLFVVCGNV